MPRHSSIRGRRAPIGMLCAAVGAALGLELHPGFWGIAGLGAVMLALTVSFATLAKRPATDQNASEWPVRDAR